MANWNPTVRHALRYDRARKVWVVTDTEANEDADVSFSDRNEARRYLREVQREAARR